MYWSVKSNHDFNRPENWIILCSNALTGKWKLENGSSHLAYMHVRNYKREGKKGRRQWESAIGNRSLIRKLSASLKRSPVLFLSINHFLLGSVSTIQSNGKSKVVMYFLLETVVAYLYGILDGELALNLNKDFSTIRYNHLKEDIGSTIIWVVSYVKWIGKWFFS